ncbi:MAG: winged helix DNA-binding domain-containing protein, partial [Chloroflexi bacterium]|nr:winged helix DNA-binding domain-containing protein [Chloroflexota bacterium]
MTGEVHSQRRLNRALLARQLLLERATLSIPQALERIAGIQNQYAPNAYIRLWSCLDRFERDDLTRAYERGTVVQGTLMRGTIHTVSARDYWPFVAAIREPLRAWA